VLLLVCNVLHQPSFENAAEAHTKMLTGKGLFGKVLLKPEGA